VAYVSNTGDTFGVYADIVYIIARISFMSVLPVIIFIPLALALGAIFRAFFGWELLLTGLNCEVSSHSVPDSLNQVSIITLRRKTRGIGLRHGLYNEPECVPRLVAWLQQAWESKS
jgi:hypothetical protein